MQKIIYTINKVNYILFEVEISIHQKHEIENYIKNRGGIIQSVKTGECALWKRSIILKYLIPEHNIY